MKEVARAAGVSVASASRALGRQGNVTAALQGRIEAAAMRLGYRTNLAARCLSSGRSGLVGIVASELGAKVIADIVTAALLALRRRGYEALLLNSGSIPAPRGAAVNTLVERGVEAVLFIGRIPDDEESGFLRARELRWVAPCDGASGAMAADAAFVRGVALAMGYLAGLGHRRFALLAPAGIDPASVSVPGAESTVAMEIAQAPPAADPAAVAAELATLLDAPVRPTAIICGSDVLALAAMRACIGRRLRVPQELSIVGFGDEPFARYCTPALTTVRVAAAELAESAVERLLAADHRESAEPRSAIAKLILRESTGPVGAASMFHVERR